MKSWREYEMEGLEFEDWPLDAKDQWHEHCELTRQERYYRDHGEDE